MKLVYNFDPQTKTAKQGLGYPEDTHFTITIPKVIWLLYPLKQDELGSDGVITQGIVFFSVDEFKSMDLDDNYLLAFRKATEDHSGDENMNMDECRTCLIENCEKELKREKWRFDMVRLP